MQPYHNITIKGLITMKLQLAIISTTILLATASFAAAPTPNNNNHSAPAHPISATHTTHDAAPKKVDAKLQAKLDAKVDAVSEADYQKIVTEYKQYLNGVPATVRQEIRGYRREMVQLNKAKSDLYKKLSQEAQKFLTKEREVKKKLPIHNRADFAKEIRNSDAE